MQGLGLRLALIPMLAAIACDSRQTPARSEDTGTGSALEQRREASGAPRSPEIAGDGRVTFRLHAPGASRVTVALDQRTLAMQNDAHGVWSVTTEPLTPDIYTYAFVADGTVLNDPRNRQAQTSFGSAQSMLVVPGPRPWLPSADVPRGAIARHTFHSRVAGDDREFFVYTPAGYDSRREQPYPVLYLLHGLGDDAERWMLGGGGAHHVFDNLIADGTAVPMVVVTTLGYGTASGPAGAEDAQNLVGYEQILFNEVMPVVDRAYRVSDRREQRAIAGVSMGGATSLYVGLRNLERFAWVGAFSSALMSWPAAIEMQAGARAGHTQPFDPAIFEATFPRLDAASNSRIKMLWIACGTADSLISQNRQLTAWLTMKGVRFTAREASGVGHVWRLWRQNLADMVPQLFKG